MRLYDCVRMIRSKNAGPFTLTVDLMFEDQKTFEWVLASESFNEQRIATIYGIDATQVAIRAFALIHTIKISMPRPAASSGSPGDRDVYGCQQHFPLADMEITSRETKRFSVHAASKALAKPAHNAGVRR
ncbi:MAG: DUF4387 domain-containing protein [Planctomycetota bacterium]|nr:DUF4387 domain-containing protein [Planctomycetota bacterium]